MKIITLNINGIRAGERKGFFDWMLKQDADIICLQETKAHQSQLTADVFYPKGYHAYFADAQKKGYSGVAIYTKQKPDNVIIQTGYPVFDDEGRYIQADFGDLSVVSLYLPSGTSGEERQAIKYQVLDFYETLLDKQLQSGRQFIIAGDVNIAHHNIDLKNWKANQKNSGFLPEERAWLDKIFGDWGFVDAFRVVNQEPEQYTWWSHRGQAWAKNVGWRIDYQIVTPNLKDAIESAEIYKDERFSDHAPLVMGYRI